MPPSAGWRAGPERAKKTVGVLSDAVIVTLAATITTLPILLVTFRQIALLSLPVNALVLPAQTGVMVFGGLALLAGMIFPPLGQVVGWAAWLFLTWTLQVIHLFAQVPGAAIGLGYVDPLWGAAYVAVLAAITFYVSRSTEQRVEIRSSMTKLLSPRFALPALGIVALLAVLAALGSGMPFWDRDIDIIVVPRGDARSLNGLLAVIDRYGVGHIVSVEIGDSRAGREWLDAVAAKQIGMIEPGSGIGIDNGAILELNEDGVARIETGATSIGIGAPHRDLRVDVIVLEEVTDQIAARLKSNPPSIVVTRSPVEPERLIEDIAFINAETRPIELIFDGAQWRYPRSAVV